jgi:hypothetical protein
MNSTVRAPRGPVAAPKDSFDAYMARALSGQASLAELLVLVAIAEREQRRSDARIRGVA